MEDTIECLESLKNNTYSNYQAFVVDNASKGNDVKVLEEKYGTFAKIIRCKENLGFTGGNNVGIDFALKQTPSPDYIFLLNNDAKIREDCLVNLVAGAQKTGVGIFGCGEKGAGEKLYFGGHLMKKNAVAGEFFKQPALMLPEKDSVLENTCVSGASMLICKDVLLAVHKSTGHYLNDKIFMYYDELDFCSSARKLGYKSFIVQNAVIFHKGSRSTGGFYNPVVYYYSVRNALLLIKKLFSFPLREIIFVYTLLLDLIKILKNIIYRRWYSVFAIFCGLYDGCVGVAGKWKHHDIVLKIYKNEKKN